MIGFYNYTVILTYMSLLSAVTGMTFAINGHFRMAVFCLALSGFFDMFDGKVARRKKDRTDDEKLFGIQLDSLCDVVAFGAFPAVICYCMGVRGSLGMLAIGFYCVCGVIRLAYFNVVETNGFFSDEEYEKVYHGLPIHLYRCDPAPGVPAQLCRGTKGLYPDPDRHALYHGRPVHRRF